MDETTVWGLASLFLLASVLYASVGHGGASAYLAVMTLWGLESAIIRPVPLILNLCVSSIAAAHFARAGHFRWPLFWPFAVTSIPAAHLGGRWATELPDAAYKPLLAAVLLFGAARLWWRLAPAEVRPPRLPARPGALACGAALGLLAGLTSTGGGVFLTPLVLLCGWATAQQAAATSALFILVNSLAGLLGWWSQQADLSAAVAPWSGAIGFWAAAVVAGGWVGSRLGSRRLGGLALRRVLALVLLIASLELLRSAWTAWGAPPGRTAVARIDRGGERRAYRWYPSDWTTPSTSS
jgi:hypothetical protein